MGVRRPLASYHEEERETNAGDYKVVPHRRERKKKYKNFISINIALYRCYIIHEEVQRKIFSALEDIV